MERTMQLMQIRTALVEVKVLSINRANIKNIMYTSPTRNPLPHFISIDGWLPPVTWLEYC